MKTLLADPGRPVAGRSPLGTRSLRWALASLSLSMLLAALGTSIANVGLPTLAAAFGATFQQVQWIVIAYLLAVTTLTVVAGRLGDLAGRRRLLQAGLVVFTLASVLCALAPNLGLLLAARALQGAGAAAMMAMTLALVGDTVPKARAGSTMGLLGTMSALGTALGPALGGLLVSSFGWRSLFLVQAPLGLLAFVLVRRHLAADRPAAPAGVSGLDPLGTLLLSLSLAAYALAMTLGRGHFGPLNLALLLAAGVGAGLFLLAETKVASPLIRGSMWRDPTLSPGLVMSALVSTVMMATLVVGPFHLSRGLGLDAAAVGLLLALGPLAAALAGVPAGRWTDRFGASRMTIAGLGVMLAGALLLASLPATLGSLAYVGPIVIVTVGYSLFQTANNTAVMADLAADQRGVVSGLLSLSRNLGLVTGASAMGAVFAWAAATSDIAAARPEAVAAGLHATFGVAAGLVLLALVVALVVAAVGRRGVNSPQTPPPTP